MLQWLWRWFVGAARRLRKGREQRGKPDPSREPKPGALIEPLEGRKYM